VEPPLSSQFQNDKNEELKRKRNEIENKARNRRIEIKENSNFNSQGCFNVRHILLEHS